MRVVTTPFGRTLPWLFAFGALICGCSRSSQSAAPAPSEQANASPPARGLSVEDAKFVLAKVGETTITLGDYAAALDRMDRFERLRYQSPERRQILLDELINVELLAQEARRQKLDQDPEVRLRLDEALRDEVLRDIRSRVPTPESLPAADVRAYFEAHRAEFREPERRRISAIVVTDEVKAKTLAEQAQAADPSGWGELVRKHSVARDPSVQTPLELEGDLGIVSAPGQPQGTGPKLSDAILNASFQIPRVGGVHAMPIRDGQRFYILRLTGRTEARERSFAEAERSIRIRIVEQMQLNAEQRLLADLKKEYSVSIDEKALARVKAPAPKERENLKNAIDN